MKHLPRQERHKRIVQGAMKAFAKSGFRGTRSRDVAKSAGVIEERIRQTGDFLSPDLKTAPLEKALTMIAARIFRISERDPDFMRLLYFAGLEGEPLAPMFFQRRVAGGIDEVASLFRLWSKRG